MISFPIWSTVIAWLVFLGGLPCSAGEKSAWSERSVSEPGIHGLLLYHEGAARPTIMVLGGSEGGFEGARPVAASIAELGYNAFAIAYFGVPETPSALVKIPLESFCQTLDWLERQPFVMAGQVGIAGGSKGAEAAMLVAGMRPELKVVIGYLPTHVVWECIDETHGTVASSWTLQGRELSFVRYRRLVSSSAESNYGWETVRDLHVASLGAAESDVSAAAVIPVERIHAAMLLFSAGRDLVWPSTSSAEAIEKRVRDLKGAAAVKRVNFAEAGHSFVHGTAEGGGSEAANKVAQKESLAELKRFLLQHLAADSNRK